MAHENTVTFSGTKTLHFQVANEVAPAPTEMINFKSTILFGVTREPNVQDVKLIIRQFVAILNSPKAGQQETLYGLIETESIFIVPGLQSFFEENFGYRIPKEIVIPLVEAANSTTRGIALMRGAGTLLDGMPIPLTDGKTVLANLETVDIPIPQEAVEAGLVAA